MFDDLGMKRRVMSANLMVALAIPTADCDVSGP